jgi:hypothetical protein
VYLAPPSSFEDPIDCKNPIRWDLLADEEIFRRYYNHIKELKPNWPEFKWRNYANTKKKIAPFKNPKLLAEFAKQSEIDFDQRFGLLSLTAISEKLFPKLGGGCKVEYVKELPIIYPRPPHSFEEQHYFQVFNKLEKWSYEEEYRTHKFYTGPAKTEDRLIEIPPEAYKEIIIGNDKPEDMKSNLLDSIPSELKNIDIIYQKS